MTLKFPLTNFFQTSGNAAALFNEQLRDGIVTFGCTLWANYPKFITEGTNPGASWARGYMNQMCSPIQSAVPAPAVPFTGGQCPGTRYTVRIRWTQNNGSLWRLLTFDVWGPISSIFGEFVPNNENLPNGPGLAEGQVQAFTQAGQPMLFTNSGPEAGPPDNAPTYEVIVFGGGPDLCGNPPISYPDNPPSSQDLITNITITNLDGNDNIYTLVYNKLSNQYNFPMNFKLNGTNVTLDLEGITIYGPPQITEPTSGNDLPVPGSDGGDDGAGGDNDTTYPDTEYPTVPELTVPTTAIELIEYVACIDGVVTSVSQTLKLVTASIPYASLVIDILSAIITDVCEMGDVQPTLGFPDYYGLKPGVNRPAIVYIYKEVVDNRWSESTYSSTVVHPTAAAIADVTTVNVPDKTMGAFVTTLNLTDGSRVRVSGDTEANSLVNFNYLLNQVEPSFIPANVNDCKTVTEYPKLQVKTVKCRQIEYYPEGRTAGVNPVIQRVIDM